MTYPIFESSDKLKKLIESPRRDLVALPNIEALNVGMSYSIPFKSELALERKRQVAALRMALQRHYKKEPSEKRYRVIVHPDAIELGRIE